MTQVNNNNLPVIVFNTSKNELFQLNDTYKTVHRKLKINWRVEINRDDITDDVLKNSTVFVLAGSQDRFSESELTSLKNFVDEGGKLIILSAEGGENYFNSNINNLLENYGMAINNDSTVRSHYYKHFHPKECVIGGGIVCQSMWQNLSKEQNVSTIPFEFTDEKLKIQFTYPYGCTINVKQPSNILMTTGPIVYPFHRPIVGYYTANINNGISKVLTVGSGHMFSDKYILADETNSLIFQYFINLMIDSTIKFTSYVFNDIEINDNKLVPDTIYLAEQPKLCLLESIDCDIPADFKKMFNMELHSITNDHLRTVIDLYRKLQVQYQPLKIIKPHFEIPMPQMQLAVFPPVYSDLPAPPLELFDLDESFSSERSQLTQLTNKCLAISSNGINSNSKQTVDEKELEYFIMECGRILGVQTEMQAMNAKEILHNIGVKIAQYKKIDS